MRVVVLVLATTLAIGLLIKSPCATGSWANGRVDRFLCYSDILPLYTAEGLSDQRVPYFDARNEYPVGQGMWMYVFSLPVSSAGSYFDLNVLGLSLLALLTAIVLYRLAGDRVLYFAAAPALALYAFLNWDLLPVALSTVAIAFFLRHRSRPSGVFLGLATAAKLFPGLFVVPFALDLRREGDRSGARTLAGWWLAVLAAINLPVMLFAFHGWSYFLRFTSVRTVNEGTIWFVACQYVGGCGNALFSKVLPVGSFLIGIVLVCALALRADPERPRWTLSFPLLIVFMLTNKVYSPQYDVWLLPWFALVFPSLRHFTVVQVAAVAVFVATYSQIGAGLGADPTALRLLELAVTARAIALIACVVAFVRLKRAAEPEPALAAA